MLVTALIHLATYWLILLILCLFTDVECTKIHFLLKIKWNTLESKQIKLNHERNKKNKKKPKQNLVERTGHET